ncbi:MAG: hypothetical protein WC133_02035 [Candidatus Omnitrophota bacterium]
MPLGFATPSLKIEPPAKKIAAGQSATLKIRIEWPQAEGPYEINSLEPKLENLTLENQNQSQSISISENSKLGQPWLPSWERKTKPGQSQESGETVSQTFLYEFRPLKTGTAVIYPFEISYRKTEAEPWSPLFVPGHEIKVVSSLPLKATLLGLIIAAGLVVAVFAGFKLRDLLKIREVARNTPPPDPKQRVYAKAEESIATFTSPDSKEKLAHGSNQLRIVVATYYDVPSKVITNSEVLAFLKTKGLPAGEFNEISRLFEQLTEVQFSRADIPAYDLDRIQKTLLQYVKGKIIIGNPNF